MSLIFDQLRGSQELTQELQNCARELLVAEEINEQIIIHFNQEILARNQRATEKIRKNHNLEDSDSGSSSESESDVEEESESAAEEEEGEKENNYGLPLHLSPTMKLVSLGKVDPRPTFQQKGYIFPLGYKAIKTWWSVKKPEERTEWTLEVKEENGAPLFTAVAKDDPGVVYGHKSSTTTWSLVMRAQKGRSDYQGCNGPAVFGFSDRRVRALIEKIARDPDAKANGKGKIKGYQKTQGRPKQQGRKSGTNNRRGTRSAQEKRPANDTGASDSNSKIPVKKEKIEQSADTKDLSQGNIQASNGNPPQGYTIPQKQPARKGPAFNPATNQQPNNFHQGQNQNPHQNINNTQLQQSNGNFPPQANFQWQQSTQQQTISNPIMQNSSAPQMMNNQQMPQQYFMQMHMGNNPQMNNSMAQVNNSNAYPMNNNSNMGMNSSMNNNNPQMNGMPQMNNATVAVHMNGSMSQMNNANAQMATPHQMNPQHFMPQIPNSVQLNASMPQMNNSIPMHQMNSSQMNHNPALLHSQNRAMPMNNPMSHYPQNYNGPPFPVQQPTNDVNSK